MVMVGVVTRILIANIRCILIPVAFAITITLSLMFIDNDGEIPRVLPITKHGSL